MKKLTAILLLCSLLLISAVPAMGMDYGDYLNSALEFMQDMYYLDVNDEETIKAALKGMFGNLDPYSGFFDNQETQQLNDSLQGSFVGIGASLEKCDEGVRIVKVYEESPAEKAGLRDGDIILAVDGVSTFGKEASAVASEIRGEKGTRVTLTIQRQSEKLDITVRRDQVTLNPVSWRIEGDVAYIYIESFTGSTGAQFGKAIDEIARRGVTRILLDLRDNAGGFVDEAVAVARKIVPEGLITRLDFKSERLTDKTYYSDLRNSPYIMAVLVNEHTASAAEILAGAIQDSGKGVLIGQKTYGKGVVQNMFYVLTPEAYAKYGKKYGLHYITSVEWLSYEGVLLDPDDLLGTIKLTTGHYLTRNGRTIHGVGLAPDIEIAARNLPNGTDLALVIPLGNTETLTPGAYGHDVYQAEKILRAAGYFESSPDRMMDQETQEAVRRFQAENQIPVSGNIDIQTRDKLNECLNTLRAEHDPAFTRGLYLLESF